MKILCVGDTDEYLAEQANKINLSSQLLFAKNFQTYTQTHSGVWYTSLGDLESGQQLEQAIINADQILYFEPITWSHPNCKVITEYLLFKYCWEKKIENFTATDPDPLKIFSAIASRKSKNPQLWAVGCSVTFGWQLEEHQRWGNVLANKLGMEMSLLAMPGSGVDWQARQILNANLIPGDIVCWLTPSFNRYEISNDFPVINESKHFSMGTYEEKQSWLPEFLTDNKLIQKILPKLHGHTEYQNNLNWFAKCYYPNQIIIDHLTLIKQVIEKCKNQVELFILTQKVIGDYTQAGIVDYYLSKICKNYIGKFDYDYKSWPDYSADNVHPGVKTHALYAEKFYKAINDQ